MSCQPLKQIPSQDLKTAIIANSQAITKYDNIVSGTGASSAFISPATNTSALIVGIAVAIQGKGGTVLELNSVTASSSNQTVAQTQAVYFPSYIPMEYQCDLSAAAGTTTGSGGIGFFTIGSGTAGTLDESTWVAYSGTASHYVSFGVTPYSTTQVFAHPYKTL